MKRLQAVIAKIDGASLRERALLFLAAVAVTSFLWNRLLMMPLAARRTTLALSLEDLRERLSPTGLARAQDSLAERYAAARTRETALRAAIAAADAQLQAAQSGMIAPTEMVAVLTDVLGHQKNLTLVLLRDLPVEPLLPQFAEGQSGAVPQMQIGPYLHPVELILQGDYLNVLAYLQELESNPWGFQWRRFELTTGDSGLEYRIEFTTLSMQSNWLGV